MSLNSFCAVANSKYKKEAAFLIYSIRAFYDFPILLYCDVDTRQYLKGFGFKNIFYRDHLNQAKIGEINQKVAHVKRHNEFHSPEYIYLKMDAMEEAISNFGNTLFVDSDICIVRPIANEMPIDDLGLSPHYSERNYVKSTIAFGIFNAGYVYAQNKEVPQEWKHIYLNESKFYEQEGMYKLMNRFKFSIFDKTHNVGFWRFNQQWQNGSLVKSSLQGVDKSNVKSWHFHIDMDTYKSADKVLRDGYKQIYDEIILSLPQHMKWFLKKLT
jgi:hypothetical protein